MSQGDALATAASTTVVLLLASRALSHRRLSLPTKAWMALAWAVIIVGGAATAAWLHLQ